LGDYRQDDNKGAEVVHVKQRSGDVRRDDAAGHVMQQADHFNRIAEAVVDHIRERKVNYFELRELLILFCYVLYYIL